MLKQKVAHKQTVHHKKTAAVRKIKPTKKRVTRIATSALTTKVNATTTTTNNPLTQQTNTFSSTRNNTNNKTQDDQLLQQPQDVNVIDPQLIFGQQAYMHKSTTGMSVARYYTNVCASKPREYWDYDNYRIHYNNLSDYDCLSKLGRGKYSEVFCGFKNSVEMPVVVKILKPSKEKKDSS
eukprot:UN02754